MFVAVRRYEVEDPKHVGEIMSRVRDEFLPMISRSPGFVDYYCYECREGGRTIITSISLFETTVGADESSRMATMWAERHLSGLIRTPPQVSAGEVKVHSRVAVA